MEQLLEDLELIDWNNSFGIYSKKEYNKLRAEIMRKIKKLEILNEKNNDIKNGSKRN